MPFGTQPGGGGGGGKYLGAGRHLVKVVPTAPYTKQGESVDTKMIRINGGESLQFVFANKNGGIEFSLPTSPPEKTGWTQDNIDGMVNRIAEYTGVVPDCIKTGMPTAKYRTAGGFLQDILNRGEPIWIVVAEDKKNPQYSRFSYPEGPAGEGDNYESGDAEEEPF